MAEKVHHIMGLSGGKDSSALAVYLRDRVPEMEYFFCDTGAELNETYEFLAKLEALLGKTIHRLGDDRGFDHWLTVYNGALPSAQMRWCTKQMKIRPLEEWIGGRFGKERVISYVAIRADEPQREGYLSTRPNVEVVYPFKEDGIDKQGVMKILDHAGIGLPQYYEWRTRSGCFFCFFQRKAEWVGLAERHPDLFEKAVAYEDKVEKNFGRFGSDQKFTWSQGETLVELIARKDEIMMKHGSAMERAARQRRNMPFIEVLSEALEDDDDTPPCQVCNL